MNQDHIYFRFIDYNPSDRFNLLVTHNNPDFIYQLLNKYLIGSYENIKSRYEITLNNIRQRITIQGSYKDIFEVHKMLVRNKVKFESVQLDELRIDYSEFLFKLK